MRLDEYSHHIAYGNRYKLRKRELIELVEYFMIRRVCVLENEIQKLKKEVDEYGVSYAMTQELRNLEKNNLKDLLRECQEYIVNTPVYPQGDEWKQKQIHRLIEKITSATGEN